MRRNWWLRGLKIGALVALVVVVLGAGVMLLWNWLLPPLTGWRAVTFTQALGLLLLCRLLFGGIRARGGPWMHGRWRHMSPEERARFREQMRERWGCDRAAAAPPQQS
jgi:hypothetical protein